MEKVLIISPADSLWTFNYIRNVFPSCSGVYVYAQEETDITKKLEAEGCTLIRGHSEKKAVFRRPAIGAVLLCMQFYLDMLRIFRRYGDFRVVHIHWILLQKMTAMRLIRRHSDRIVCTFWGSDLLRVSQRHLRRFRSGLGYADVITVSTPEMRRRFLQTYGAGPGKKLRRARFGLEVLKCMDAPGMDTASCKAHFHIPQDKICITAGYNGHTAQQHLEVLKVLAGYEESVRQKLFLILPVTYGLEQDYREKLLEALEGLGCGYRLFEQSLEDEEIGKLRMAADIFIHAQTTDAFSASVQEYLYAGKTVFNPSWIRYRDLEKEGVWYIEYEDFTDLGRKLLQCLEPDPEGRDTERMRSANREKIRKLSSWESAAKVWRALYSG